MEFKIIRYHIKLIEFDNGESCLYMGNQSSSWLDDAPFIKMVCLSFGKLSACIVSGPGYIYIWNSLLLLLVIIVVVQSSSCVWFFTTSWTATRQSSLYLTNSWNLPTLMSIESVMPSCHLILWSSLLLLHSIVSTIRVFSIESADKNIGASASVLSMSIQFISFKID